MSWNNDGPPPIFEGEDELALKLKWARLTGGDESRFRTAGYEVFEGPAEYGRAMQAYAWRHDPIVHREWERMKELPSHDDEDEEVARIKKIAFQVMESPTASNADKIKAAALLAEMKGKIKQGVNINNNIDNRVQSVLVVPARKTIEEAKQQFLERKAQRTIEHARTSH